MAYVRKIKASLVREDSSVYVGEDTYLFYDIQTGYIRIWNGQPGGRSAFTEKAQYTTRSVTGSGQLLTTDEIILNNATTDISLSLLSAATFTPGKAYIIKNLTAHAITVIPFAGETIDGQTAIVISQQYTSITIMTDTVNWYII